MHKEQLIELYRKEYKDTCEFCEVIETKHEWAASYVFGLVTYDGDMDKLFVDKIIEVCKVILSQATYEYINQSHENYLYYLWVIQLIKHKEWISWGTSVRGVWFNANSMSDPILAWTDNGNGPEIPFSIDNLEALIEFMEED